MKTITEFSGFTLKDSITKKANFLTEGKTEEEAQLAINELLKLSDETKVSFYKNALDMSKSRIDQVKRVVVAVKSSETEKVPEAFSEREGNFYLVEYFPQAGAAHRSRSEDRFDRKRGSERGRGDRGRGDRGRDGRSREDRSREDRSREDRGQAKDFSERRESRPPRPETPAGERKPRPPRTPRPAREPRTPRPFEGPKGAAELRLVLKGQSQSTLQGSGQVTASPASEATSSETQQG